MADVTPQLDNPNSLSQEQVAKPDISQALRQKLEVFKTTKPSTLFEITSSQTKKGNKSTKLKLTQKGHDFVLITYEELVASFANSPIEVQKAIVSFRQRNEKGRFIDSEIKEMFPNNPHATNQTKHEANLERRSVKKLLNALSSKAKYEQKALEDAVYREQAQKELTEENNGKNPSASKFAKRVKKIKTGELQEKESKTRQAQEFAKQEELRKAVISQELQQQTGKVEPLTITTSPQPEQQQTQITTKPIQPTLEPVIPPAQARRGLFGRFTNLIKSNNPIKPSAHPSTRPKATMNRRGFLKLGTTTAAVGALAVTAPELFKTVVNAQKIQNTPLQFDESTVFGPSVNADIKSSSPTAGPAAFHTTVPTRTTEPSPTQAPLRPSDTPAPSPTPKPIEVPPSSTDQTKLAKEMAGSKNLTEYFLGNLVDLFIKKRLERYNNPEVKDRIAPEFLNSRNINFLYLGIDQTRDRPNDFIKDNEKGLGLSDIMMLISFDPHTFKTTAISIPRDTFAPETLKYFPNTPKINTVTMAPYIDRNVDSNELAKKSVESAFGLPVDAVVKTNIDFMQIFDDIFPDGLEVNVPKKIVDSNYPGNNYSKITVSFEPGPQKLHSEQLVQFARSRYSTSDFDRSDRQRVILEAAMTHFFPRLIEEFTRGDIKTIDNIITALEKQENNKNLFYDVNVIEIFKQMNTRIQEMVKTNQGKLALGMVAANTLEVAKKLMSNRDELFTSIGFSTDEGGLIQDQSYGTYLARPVNKKGGFTNAQKLTSGNYLDYWQPIRERVKEAITGAVSKESEVAETIPSKEEKMLYPAELSKEEVIKWVGKLRDTHDAVLTESLFTKEYAVLPKEMRDKVLKAIAKAHAEALIEHYGDVDTIIGLDPGHGNTDVGSGGITAEGKPIAEKDIMWELTSLTAEEIYNQSKGKYTIIILRPENPNDQDTDGDSVISTYDRLQKRKALLMDQEVKLRPNPENRGKNIVYLSLHFNGSSDPSQVGTEVYWPNITGMGNENYRKSSKNLALNLQAKIIKAIQEAGYKVFDRGAKEDTDQRNPLSNAETTVGPYLALGSPKLDRVPQKI